MVDQSEYALYGQAVTLTETVNGINRGTAGRIVKVKPGFLGSKWSYAFVADDWEITQHPFTWVDKDQFKIIKENVQ